MVIVQSVQNFLEECQVSGDAAYAQLKKLLDRLQNPESRSYARRFLSDIEKQISAEFQAEDDAAMAKYHFRIHQLPLTNPEDSIEEAGGYARKRHSLTLMEMSSIFLPENWSFTFYEGMCRHEDAGFRDRYVTELGCGNGWISIALADRYHPRKVYGLDINPRAIKIAWINLYLNALNPDGTAIVDEEGKTLLDRVEFYESDLLAYIRENKILLDRVVGCIPQVLTPDTEKTIKIVSESMSEEFLYSLSNYCGLQGFVEDQFGLGLIARAVEEAIEVLKPSGFIILNMGGRPGHSVCERLFKRRGFHISRLWQTRVEQAGDTDILTLVEIEQKTRHRFEFYLNPTCKEPITAKTAYAYSKLHGTIAHTLTVYQGRLRYPNHVKAIFRFLSRDGYQDTRSAVDLAFQDQAVEDEKLPFLAHLAHFLQARTCFPSEPPAGNTRFRTQLAKFLRLYYSVPICTNNIVVLPSRLVAFESLLAKYNPKLALVESSLLRYLPRKYTNVSAASGSPVILEAPKRCSLIIDLATVLKPQLVIASLADFEMQTAMVFQQLLATCGSLGARLLVDISEYFDLSSAPTPNGVLHFLAENPLPPHAALICGLVKNQVYLDLEVCFMLSESVDFLESMAAVGQLSYSQTPTLSQLYYGCLLQELLGFQMPEKDTLPLRSLVGPGCQDLTASCQDGAVIHLDVVENWLESPEWVKQFVFEGYVRQNLSESEMDVVPELLGWLEASVGLPADVSSQADVIVTDGFTSSFSGILAAMDSGSTLLLPAGLNGTLVDAAGFQAVKVQILPTDLQDGFKLTAEKLADAVKGGTKPWLLLPYPTVSPTGAVYSSEELAQISEVCGREGVTLVLDVSLAAMDFHSQGTAMLDFSGLREKLIIVGEVSKQLSVGGLGFGFALIFSSAVSEMAKEHPIGRLPHGTLRFAIKKTLAALTERWLPKKDSHVSKLKQRAVEFSEALSSHGWVPLLPQGGLSLVASPRGLLGKRISLDSGEEIIISYQNVVDALLRVANIAARGEEWCHLPGYVSFTFSVSEDKYSAALQQLEVFHSSLVDIVQ